MLAMPSACSLLPNVPVPVVSGAAASMPINMSSGIFDSCSVGIDLAHQAEAVEQRISLERCGAGSPVRNAERRILHDRRDEQVGVALRERRGRRTAERVPHHDTRLAGRLFERGDCVADVAGGAVLTRGAVGAPVSAEVEPQDVEPFDERRHDPVPCATERRDAVEQEDRRRATDRRPSATWRSMSPFRICTPRRYDAGEVRLRTEPPTASTGVLGRVRPLISEGARWRRARRPRRTRAATARS